MGAIDSAWARAQAALPDGWTIRELYQLPTARTWLARAAMDRTPDTPPRFSEGFGTTPDDALESLARELGKRGGRGSAVTEPDGSIDDAWRQVHEHLPEGWTIRELYRLRSEIWAAAATVEGSMEQPGDHAEAFGATPAAALQALSLQLQLKSQ